MTTYNPLAIAELSKEQVRSCRIPGHFRAAWLRLKQTDLIPGKGQFH